MRKRGRERLKEKEGDRERKRMIDRDRGSKEYKSISLYCLPCDEREGEGKIERERG